MLAAIAQRHPTDTVDLIGYSAGGVVARLALVNYGAGTVARLITIAAPHLGTEARLGGAGCDRRQRAVRRDQEGGT